VASLSYISPKIAEKCTLKPEKFKNAWLVQLATSIKRKVTSQIRQYLIDLNGYSTKVDLNILPLGSYDILISMDSLEKHGVVINCLEKTMSCVSQDGQTQLIRGKPKEISV